MEKTLMGLDSLTNSWNKSMHTSKLFTVYLEIYALCQKTLMVLQTAEKKAYIQVNFLQSS